MTDETRNPTHEAEPPDEEKVGELLRRHRALYHDPPRTPREAIWSRIEAERRGAGGIGRGAHVIPFAPRNWWLGTLAVAAVLALGIALGRMSLRQEAERQGAAGPPVASVETPAAGRESPREPDTGARPEAELEPGAEIAAPEQLAVAPEAAEEPEAAAPRPSGRRQAAPAPAPRAEEPAVQAPAVADPEQLYRLASQQMLGQAEALLVQYQTDRAADRMDPAIARWARDVLTSTRLLLDSPAADDPGMRDLLEDLELVLTQIVQRTGETDLLDDEMIDRTIEDRDLMPRLRGAIPVGVGAI
ncbi:MAG TPA: hypothetical protein VFQ21_09660 [Gemmatimonadota bacterium]|nr:hypothetical protein [Gemmatimonadota bacterium]